MVVGGKLDPSTGQGPPNFASRLLEQLHHQHPVASRTCGINTLLENCQTIGFVRNRHIGDALKERATACLKNRPPSLS